MSKRVIYKNCSLCWSCKNAVPTAVQDPRTGERKYTQGCAWSIHRQPVKGWDAEKSEMTGYVRHTMSMIVLNL